ncbi:hypothetical protein V8F06_004954 [Rhypophila decipiens]
MMTNPSQSGTCILPNDTEYSDNNYTQWSEVIGKLARNMTNKKHADSLLHVRNKYTLKNPNQGDAQRGDAQRLSDDPMDVDRLVKISPAERDRRYQNNLCLACGEPGHRAAEHHGPNARPMPSARGGRDRGSGRGNYGRDSHQQRQDNQQPHHSIAPYYGSQSIAPYYGPQFNQPQLRTASGFVIGDDENSTTTSLDCESTTSDQQSKDTPLA